MSWATDYNAQGSSSGAFPPLLNDGGNAPLEDPWTWFRLEISKIKQANNQAAHFRKTMEELLAKSTFQNTDFCQGKGPAFDTLRRILVEEFGPAEMKKMMGTFCNQTQTGGGMGGGQQNHTPRVLAPPTKGTGDLPLERLKAANTGRNSLPQQAFSLPLPGAGALPTTTTSRSIGGVTPGGTVGLGGTIAAPPNAASSSPSNMFDLTMDSHLDLSAGTRHSQHSQQGSGARSNRSWPDPKACLSSTLEGLNPTQSFEQNLGGLLFDMAEDCSRGAVNTPSWATGQKSCPLGGGKGAVGSSPGGGGMTPSDGGGPPILRYSYSKTIPSWGGKGATPHGTPGGSYPTHNVFSVEKGATPSPDRRERCNALQTKGSFLCGEGAVPKGGPNGSCFRRPDPPSGMSVTMWDTLLKNLEANGLQRVRECLSDPDFLMQIGSSKCHELVVYISQLWGQAVAAKKGDHVGGKTPGGMGGMCATGGTPGSSGRGGIGTPGSGMGGAGTPESVRGILDVVFGGSTTPTVGGHTHSIQSQTTTIQSTTNVLENPNRAQGVDLSPGLNTSANADTSNYSPDDWSKWLEDALAGAATGAATGAGTAAGAGTGTGAGAATAAAAVNPFSTNVTTNPQMGGAATTYPQIGGAATTYPQIGGAAQQHQHTCVAARVSLPPPTRTTIVHGPGGPTAVGSATAGTTSTAQHWVPGPVPPMPQQHSSMPQQQHSTPQQHSSLQQPHQQPHPTPPVGGAYANYGMISGGMSMSSTGTIPQPHVAQAPGVVVPASPPFYPFSKGTASPPFYPFPFSKEKGKAHPSPPHAPHICISQMSPTEQKEAENREKLERYMNKGNKRGGLGAKPGKGGGPQLPSSRSHQHNLPGVVPGYHTSPSLGFSDIDGLPIGSSLLMNRSTSAMSSLNRSTSARSKGGKSAVSGGVGTSGSTLSRLPTARQIALARSASAASSGVGSAAPTESLRGPDPFSTISRSASAASGGGGTISRSASAASGGGAAVGGMAFSPTRSGHNHACISV